MMSECLANWDSCGSPEKEWEKVEDEEGGLGR